MTAAARARGLKSGRRSGWHNKAAGGMWAAAQLAPQAEETAWERLLCELGLAEDQAALAIERRDVRGERLRQFVRRAFLRRYVPEQILRAMGLAQDVERLNAIGPPRGPSSGARSMGRIHGGVVIE